MIEKFQCPGCVAGMNIECRAFKLFNADGFFRCESHVAGTLILGIGSIFLGLPKGFNRLGPRLEQRMDGQPIPRLRLWEKGQKPDWDKFNVPVWALEREGYLFTRTYSPRINFSHVDIVAGGTLDMCPNAINVGEFYSEMD